MNIPRILLADDHPQILANLSRLAEQAGEVVGAAQDGRAVMAEALQLHPDEIILDLAMPGMSGLDVARLLRWDMPESRIIICTVYTNLKTIDEAFAAGAIDFVRKQSAHTDLAPAIRAALVGDRFVSPALRYGETRAESSGSARDAHNGGER